MGLSFLFGFLGGDFDLDGELFLLLLLLVFGFLGGDFDLEGEFFLLLLFVFTLGFLGGDFETDLDGDFLLSTFPL